jgi:hypothetical protein
LLGGVIGSFSPVIRQTLSSASLLAALAIWPAAMPCAALERRLKDFNR